MSCYTYNQVYTVHVPSSYYDWYLFMVMLFIAFAGHNGNIISGKNIIAFARKWKCVFHCNAPCMFINDTFVNIIFYWNWIFLRLHIYYIFFCHILLVTLPMQYTTMLMLMFLYFVSWLDALWFFGTVEKCMLNVLCCIHVCVNVEAFYHNLTEVSCCKQHALRFTLLYFTLFNLTLLYHVENTKRTRCFYLINNNGLFIFSINQ